MTDSDRRLLYTIVGAYLAIGITWILATDLLVNLLVPSGPLESIIESSKGTLYVVVTGAGLFVLVRSLLLWRRESVTQTVAHDDARDRLVFQSQLLDAVGQAVIATDPQGIATYWNKAAEDLYGWSEAEALGKPVVSLTVPDGSDLIADRMMTDIISGGGSWSGQIQVKRKDGSTFPAIVKDTPVIDEDDNVIAIIGVSTDISELVDARERLARSEELHRAVLENISDAVFLTDERGGLTYVCPNVHVIFGLNSSEVMEAGNIAHLLGEDLTGREALMGTDEVSNIETEVVDTRGRNHVLLATIKRVDMSDGDLLYTCRDVTDRVAAERERERALARLEVLRKIDTALLSARTVDELAAEALTSLRQIVSYDTATLFSMEGDGNSLLVTFSDGHPPGFIEVGDEVPVKDLGLSEVGTGLDQPVMYMPDLKSIPSAPAMIDWLIERGLRSVLGLRLFARGSLVGLLALGHEHENGFSREDIIVAADAASSLGIGVQNLKYFQEQQQRVRVMDTLRQAALDLTSQLDLEEVVQAVCHRSLELAGADNAHIFHYDGQNLEFAAAVWREGMHEKVYKTPREDGLTATVAKSGEIVVVNESRRHPLYRSAFQDWNGGIIGVPLKFEGQVIAVMNVSFQQPHDFGNDEIHALQLLADQAAIAITNARSYQEVARQRGELSTLLEVAKRLASRHTLDEVLQTIVDAVVETLPGAEAASVMLTDQERRRLVVRAWRGHDQSVMQRLSLRVDESLAGKVFLSGRPQVLNRAQDQESFRRLGIPELDRLEALFGIPLTVDGETVGALFADNFSRADAFSTDDLPLMESLAAQASVAIESANLFDQIQASRKRLAELSSQLVEVQEEERRHLARELHDQIGQSLTGLKLLLEMSAGLPSDDTQENLAQAQDLVAELLGQIRDMSLDLRPSMLDDLGLVPALTWLVDRLARNSGVEIGLKQDVPDERFPSQVETAAYRVIQEGLTNAVRHSQSDRVVVRVSRYEGALRVEVEDYGRGFDVDGALADPSTSGLSGMRERVTLLGGRIAIDSITGEGSRVIVEFPLDGPLERRASERNP